MGPEPSKPPRTRPGLHVPVPIQAAPRPLELPALFVSDLQARLDFGEIRSKEDLHRLKLVLSRRHGVAKVPSDADLFAALPADAAARHRVLLRKKATRTLSGVAIVTLQSSPEYCPHGTCIFCPGGPDVGTAQSYTGEEPAALRARSHAYDPYAQTASRLAALQATGHDTDKVDLIIQGGTFPAREGDYQTWFVKRALDAMNDAHLDWPRDPATHPGAADLEAAKRDNESAPARMIGLTVETKPDWWLPAHIDLALEYGATRVEIGVQTLDDAVLARVNRGHDLATTRESLRHAKESGFKLVAHLMPGLPGMTLERDLEMAIQLFAEPAYRPDMLKIYPTLVMPGTPLARIHERGAYTPLGTTAAADLIARLKRELPPYVRIQRIDRDIPTTLIAGGVDRSNLRELAHARLRDAYGERCRCVRCREVGHQRRNDTRQSRTDPDPPTGDDEARLILTDHRYTASGGEERFLAVEDPADGALFGYLRLRRLAAPHRSELSAGDAMIREVKVPGTLVPIGEHNTDGAQHRGIGARLVEEALRIARDDWDAPRLFVIAGVGVKPYYRRLGFQDTGAYLALEPQGTGGKTLAAEIEPMPVPRAWIQPWDLDRHPRPARQRQHEHVPPHSQ